jgi:hypothetical protein
VARELDQRRIRGTPDDLFVDLPVAIPVHHLAAQLVFPPCQREKPEKAASAG